MSGEKQMLTRSQSTDPNPKQSLKMTTPETEAISDAMKTLIAKTVQNEIQSLSSTLSNAVDDNNDLKCRITALEKRLQLTEGLLHQAQIKIAMQNEKIIDLQARSMRENVIIRGIPESEQETWDDTEAKVVDFMKKELKIPDADGSMIDRAHRMGPKNFDKPRNIAVKLSSSKAKNNIFKNVKNLAGKKHLSVQDQLPQEVQERRNRLWPRFKEAKERAKQDKSIKVRWSLDKLHVNGKVYSASDDIQCFDPDLTNTNTHIAHSSQLSEQGSTFQSHAAYLKQGDSVAGVLASLYSNRSIAKAEHNMYAYRLKEGDSVKESCSDDGEHGAGNRLLRLLREHNETDIVLICTRWFGGVHIGPKRFEHMTNSANEALQKLKSKD